jgi:hypothetical protein
MYQHDPEEAACVHPARHIATRWYLRDTAGHGRDYIEAMLMARDADYALIASHLGVCDAPAGLPPSLSDETVSAYNDAYFCARDDAGALTASDVMLLNMSYDGGHYLTRMSPAPAVWRSVGLRFGYRALLAMWGMPHRAGGPDDGSFQALEAAAAAGSVVMLRRVLTGDMPSVDITSMFAQYIAMERHRREAGGGNDAELFALGMELLRMLGPRLAASAAPGSGELGLTLENPGIRSEAEVESRIHEIELKPAAGGVDEVNRQLRNKLAQAQAGGKS